MAGPQIDTVIAALGAALALSLTVERIIEGIKNVFSYFLKDSPDVTAPPLAKLERRADEIVKKYQDQTKRLQDETTARENTNSTPGVGEWDERVGVFSLTVEPATGPNMTRVLREFMIQILGLIAGIVLAHGAQLKLFSLFLASVYKNTPQSHLPDGVDYLLTGLLIGGGSAPIHLLIRFISERRITPAPVETNVREPESATTETSSAAAAPIPVSSAMPKLSTDLFSVAYDGGVDCSRLQNTHFRSANPNMIVLHHTAMHIDSSFDDVVRTIKDRTDKNGNHWITGYHCVIMADGSIRPFCRWDRFGNHASGYNDRSLGLSFNGNFESNPKVPFSNPDGRFGAVRPTLAQLNAGARVIALWSLLYDIPLDFDKSIIPHRKISNKTCPGTNFPLAEFNDLVKATVTAWKESPNFEDQMKTFKLKPYLFVDSQVAHG